MVYEDVLEEKLSVDYAKRVYGVVIDPVSLKLDVKATEILRFQMAEGKSR